MDEGTHGSAWDFSAAGGPRLVSEQPEGLKPLVAATVTPPFGAGTDAADLGAPPIDQVTPIGAPIRWLAAAGACVAAAFALGAPTGSHPTRWVAGWVMGGFACVGLLAVFTLVDSRRRADAWYSVRPMVSHVRTALIVLAALAVALNSWRFADWVSRR